MSEAPERIWLIETDKYNPYRVSCSTAPHSPDESTEYVRADRTEALEREVKEAEKANRAMAQNGLDLANSWQSRAEAAETREARLSEALRTLLDCPDIADNDHKDEETHAAERVARAALSGSGSGWREITEDDRPPNDVEVLMGCWESWPRNQWVVEYGLYGSTKGGWIHGRMTHWLPSSYLPAAPQQGGE
jgi:hypothetical protein